MAKFNPKSKTQLSNLFAKGVKFFEGSSSTHVLLVMSNFPYPHTLQMSVHLVCICKANQNFCQAEDLHKTCEKFAFSFTTLQ